MSRNFFFRARADKGIARHIDVSSVVWTLVDNGLVIFNLVPRVFGKKGEFRDWTARHIDVSSVVWTLVDNGLVIFNLVPRVFGKKGEFRDWTTNPPDLQQKSTIRAIFKAKSVNSKTYSPPSVSVNPLESLSTYVFRRDRKPESEQFFLLTFPHTTAFNFQH